MDGASSTSDGPLRDRIDQLTLMIEALQDELAALRAERRPQHVSRRTGADRQASTSLEPSSSRRLLLKMAGGVAITAAGAALSDGVHTAAAATGDAMLVGNEHYAANLTRIKNGSGAVGPGESLTTEKVLFWVDNTDSDLDDAVGVRGEGRDDGSGVDGHGGKGVTGTGRYIGVAGIGDGAGSFGIAAVGGRAAILLGSVARTEPPTRSDAHSAGELENDGHGSTWLCVTDGAPGTWRKIGGPSTAGSFHAIVPIRAFDSRWAGNARLSGGSDIVVSVADAHDLDGVVVTGDVVPPGATAIAYNITVTRTVGTGYLSVNPGSAAAATSSSINWFGDNQDIANGLIVGLDAHRQVRIFAGGGGSTHYIVDVTGYFL